MFYTVLSFLFLVVAGGFIAYYGDLTGRRWGKRRVSWFGMRPKHTAILITVITGSMIALLTITALLAVAPAVRNVALRGESAIREYRSLESTYRRDVARYQLELAGRKTELAHATQQLDALNTQLNAVKREHSAVCRELTGLQTEIAESTRKNQKLEARTRDLENKSHSLERTRRELALNIETKREIVSKLSAKVNSLTAQAANAEVINKDLGKQTIALTRQNDALSQSNADLITANDNLTTRNRELKSLGAELARKNEELVASNVTLTKEKEARIRENNALLEAMQEQSRENQNNVLRLYGQLVGARRNASRAEIAQAYFQMRQGEIAIRGGAELARHVIAPHLGKRSVHRILLSLLDNAGVAARGLGASGGRTERAVRIVNKRIITLTGLEDTDENACLNALAENIAGSDTPVVVIAEAVNNTLAGEQALIELSPHSVKRLFEKNDVVASCQIEVDRSLDRVVEQIVQFLKKDVRDAALRAGVLPQIDPRTGANEVGIVGPRELVLLTERIHKLGGPITLTAVASEPLTSADPLKLKFNVRPAQRSAARK